MLRGGARLGLQIHDRNQNIRPTVVSLWVRLQQSLIFQRYRSAKSINGSVM